MHGKGAFDALSSEDELLAEAAAFGVAVSASESESESEEDDSEDDEEEEDDEAAGDVALLSFLVCFCLVFFDDESELDEDAAKQRYVEDFHAKLERRNVQSELESESLCGHQQ